ncbi:DUF2087 domain-containing protein [Cohnella faecalis]|uniref:DUF2087 domain-containing protein n=1 Tax=Cohnella faecalis TaxID=2315694 RepID=A0A398CM06_9BACL|nr:DUF2087 domain-containing protein [Cohnella faecalis]RIE02249.1 DUF2087 domain-containing protein [Cohnella faecalis]
MDLTERFWNASLEELKWGYAEEKEAYVCLVCGHSAEKGVVYPGDGVWYEAAKYIRRHVEGAHGSMFDYLVSLDKKLTGLTEHQAQLLRLFHQGRSDAEVQKELGIGSASTIRNHRFALKEKERQAKLFLAMMELLKERDRHAPAFMDVHRTARMVDDRYNVTEREREAAIAKYFLEGPEGMLKTFKLPEKQKLIVLRQIADRFERGRIYTEKESNEVLKTAYDDYVILRRYLIEYGFLDRKPDGSEYWLKD